MAFLVWSTIGYAQDSSPVASKPPELVGPPTRYFIDVERYRFGNPDVANIDFYPIPQDIVTRETYLRWHRRNEPMGNHPESKSRD